jgi:hypothetical protein
LIYKGRLDPKRRRTIPDRSFESSPFSSGSAPRVKQERGSDSSSTTLVVFLLSNEREGSTSAEAFLGLASSDPLPTLYLFLPYTLL